MVLVREEVVLVDVVVVVDVTVTDVAVPVIVTVDVTVFVLLVEVAVLVVERVRVILVEDQVAEEVLDVVFDVCVPVELVSVTLVIVPVWDVEDVPVFEVMV